MNFIIDGFIGALTFGMYSHYISMRQIEQHNQKIEKQRTEFLNKMNRQLMNFSFLN